MSKISRSPNRFSFQKEGYIKRMEENGETPDDNYLDYFQKIIEQHNKKFDDPKTHVNNLEYDLLTTDWILEKTRDNDAYAQNLYAAMCNNGFIKLDVIPILKQEEWSCSWRYAGGIIADMQQKGDYIDWYCSGIRDNHEPSEEEWNSWTSDQQKFYTNFTSKYVPEGRITDEIRSDLQRLGWAVAPGGDWENFV